MADYLLEIGCEEIPATMVAKGVADLSAELTKRLTAEGLPSTSCTGFGGPRRLAVVIHGLAARQEDRTETVIGPPWDKAFDGDGNPTRAAEGFAKKLGVDVGSLRKEETKRGVCVAGEMHTAGRSASEVLGELVPAVLGSLTFRKMMRWGAGEVRFVRAVRSIVSLLDTEIVPVAFAEVNGGRDTFGHRFLGARSIALADVASYQGALEREHVIVAADVRSARLEAQIAKLADGLGTADDDDALLAEVAYFVEEPHVVRGSFDSSFLDLPPEVLVTSMKVHQKSFPIWKQPGRELAAAFLAVANIPDVEGHVVKGCERVLKARLDDARFFWDEDRKRPLMDRVPELDRLVLQEKLGSYGAKARRLAQLAPAVATHLGLGDSAASATKDAATVAKADLVTGMVGEFPELQGVMGGLYLRAEGANEDVASAVYEHYMPLSLDGPPPTTPAGSALAIADKLDTLVGCFGVGLIPTGTRDPLGLRRAAQGMLKTVFVLGSKADLEPLLMQSAALHHQQPGAASVSAEGLDALRGYLMERVEFLLKSEGLRHDSIAAALATRPLDVVDARARSRAIESARDRDDFEQTFTVLKRVANIAGEGDDEPFDPAALVADEERALAAKLETVASAAAAATGGGDYEAAIGHIRELGAPLHALFDRVLVMDPDEAVRVNRLRLLRAIGRLAAPIGDFSKIQMERKG